jgi:hypothetical protein
MQVNVLALYPSNLSDQNIGVVQRQVRLTILL